LIIGEQTDDKSVLIDSIGNIVAVVVIILVTAFINWTKEQQFRGLKKKLELQSKYSVIRSGQIHDVLAADIVVGDICIIKYGMSRDRTTSTTRTYINDD